MVGNVAATLENLRSQLRSARYPMLSELDGQGMLAGRPTAFLPVLHWLLLGFSDPLGHFITDKGFALGAKSDLRFIEAVYKLLREHLGYSPALTVTQFFTNSFAERKVLFCQDVLRIAQHMHAELSVMAATKQAAMPRQQVRSSSLLQQSSASANAADVASGTAASAPPLHLRKQASPKAADGSRALNPWAESGLLVSSPKPDAPGLERQTANDGDDLRQSYGATSDDSLLMQPQQPPRQAALEDNPFDALALGSAEVEFCWPASEPLAVDAGGLDSDAHSIDTDDGRQMRADAQEEEHVPIAAVFDACEPQFELPDLLQSIRGSLEARFENLESQLEAVVEKVEARMTVLEGEVRILTARFEEALCERRLTPTQGSFTTPDSLAVAAEAMATDSVQENLRKASAAAAEADWLAERSAGIASVIRSAEADAASAAASTGDTLPAAARDTAATTFVFEVSGVCSGANRQLSDASANVGATRSACCLQRIRQRGCRPSILREYLSNHWPLR
eukprot:TRINITY_DN46039_c0_g2_i3.p1 TRINITY_DN46039_c0_g2~~TRINITY_DN46039_c0_g2_i3.p1  ORF type:complete len:509 (+),score=112.33 TRINITY_DN46039_c0_g2_i3:106-1632(+)